VLLAVGDDDPGLEKMPVGARLSLDGESVTATVLRTGRAARMDSYENARGSAAARLRDLGLRAAVGAPIIVGGRVWGAAIVGSSRPEPMPPDAEARVGDFADLVATAIANAQAHADLTASRARIVAAGDEARRRFERDLHDGAQQRLVSLGLELRTAEACVPPGLHPLKEQISGIVHGLAGVSDDLREISHGIHPAILSKEDSGQHSSSWPGAPRCRSSSTSVSTDACPSPPKWPPITSLPKPSPTSPSTHKRPRSPCASKPTMPTSVFPFRTTRPSQGD
jgi:signal transduction histidine kinase